MYTESTTILLVEDNLPDAQYTKELLTTPAYAFIEAASLAKALECVDNNHIDVILLDLSLPDSHGLETLKQLASGAGKTPIVILTGLEDVAFAVEAMRLGARDYIVKNKLTTEALAHSIGSAIESTKRKLIEAQLVEAEQRLHLALEGSSTGTWVRLFETGEMICDAQTKALFGVDGDFRHTFDNFLELVHPDDRVMLLSQPPAVLKDPDGESEYRVIWPDGKIHWISSKGKVSNDDDGKPVRSAGVCVNVCDRKQAEKERSQLAAIVESSDAGIIGTSLDDIVTSWNNAAERMYGYRADEMLGENISILIPAFKQIEPVAVNQRVTLGQYVDQFESTRIRKDGVIIDVSVTVSAVKDASGTIVGASTIARDITRRKRDERLHVAQNAVTIALSEYASLAEAGPQILRVLVESLQCSVGQIWQVDPVERVLRSVSIFNKPQPNILEFVAISKQIAFTQELDLPARTWLSGKAEWIIDLSKEPRFSRSRAAAKANLHFACSFPITQGELVLGVIEFFNDAQPQCDSELEKMMANVCAQVGQFMNRKFAEEAASLAMQAQQTITKAILENAPIGIAKLGKNLQFNEVNAAFSQQFGVSMDTLRGKFIFEVTAGMPIENLHEIVKSGTPFRSENVQIQFDGTAQDALWDLAAWPIKENSGAITGVILMTTNVTERAKLSRQREDFVATLSHDLKNPLIGQNRVLDLFIQEAVGPLTAHQIEILSMLRTSTWDMLELIGNLLEVYRYDAGVQQLAFEQIEAQGLIDGCVAQMLLLAQTKGVKLNSSVAGITVSADRMALRRVFMNLLDNAVKFGSAGTNVEISCHCDETNCVFQIKDSGQGMEKLPLSTLFQRFAQTDLGRGHGTGTGLGLYLCRQIVEAHGGTIACQSEEGVGTTFVICLPKERRNSVSVTGLPIFYPKVPETA